MRQLVLFIALGTSGFSTAGFAQTGIPMAADGPVSRAAYIARADARFQQTDTDHDGTVSRAEADAYRQAMHDRRLADRGPDDRPPPPPRDRDDAATRGEQAPRGGPEQRSGRPGDVGRTRQAAIDDAARRFDRLDTNHDGMLDRTERDAGRPMRGGPRGDGSTVGSDMPPPHPPVHVTGTDALRRAARSCRPPLSSSGRHARR